MSDTGTNYGEIVKNGLWEQNVVFAQMLALCPLMAVTTSGTNGLGMGLATTAVLVCANVLVSLIRQVVSAQVRIPVFIVLIATLVTIVDMAMNAWLHELYKVLGLFIALIVVNCAILGRSESFAVKNGVAASAVDGLAMGLGFTGALVLLGLVREFLGSGTLFAQASQLLGPAFSFLEVKIPGYGGALLMILPPGAFAALGFLLAGKRLIDRRLAEREAARAAVAAA
ncbi:MAG: electron transport complex subunit E [Gammaproteobacteria bacterium]|nr:electron transport complex subunit E [Gammaproteobacteria bacterium]MBU1602789.1 electron transport complex subunit E [Gammaproteobacteria bacterium]MBU2432461.1 electron transport complex subunit E [Gammaproteobacteria bacterium]MBU2448996.1 electron transport complex subunit E [Gammaproteobacteria bacterium]